MISIGFRIFCITIAVLFFFESAFSSITLTRNSSLHKNSSHALLKGAAYEYGAFGNLIDYFGTWSGPFAYGGAFGYQADDDSGLMLLGHRYYDPSTGRFLSRDPIGDGSNWYSYCRNSPIRFFDSDGNAQVEIRYRHVAGGGYHAYIVVTGPEIEGRWWYISGGPPSPKAHPERVKEHLLTARWGEHKEGGYDWPSGGQKEENERHRIILVKNDLPAKVYVDACIEIGEKNKQS